VIDPESGLDGVRNLGLRNGRIERIATEPLRGRTVIDARGLVVAPGFIDLHRHGHGDEGYRSQVLDGITSAFELEVGVGDINAWYAEREPGKLLNYGAAIGHIPVRMQVLHDPGEFLPSGPAAQRAATDVEIIEMMRLLDQGLQDGAVAVGMGLAYTPQASAMEALQVFRMAAQHRASVHIHLRGGMSGLIEAIGDATISGAPLHVVHVNSTGGRNTPFLLKAIEDARARGADVTTEAYPYTAGATRIESALYDDWRNWPDERFSNMQWPATGERLTRATFEKYRAIGGTVVSHSNTEEMVAFAINHPLTMIASDGGPAHPRGAGTYAKVLGRYVREQHGMTLPVAIAKMTLLPAQRLEGRVPEMKDRGRIRQGAFADIVVFDADRIIDHSTYENPRLPSEGIRHVLVNGTQVVRDGKIVEGVRPGRGIRATRLRVF
jgi:N-acyl-D-aspartate/D-glutamate deacylase